MTPTDQEREDFWYFWRVAGQVLGIDREAMPRDFAEATQFFERVQARHCGKSNEGIELTKALLAFYTRIVPGASLFDGLVPGIVRFLAGDVVADALEVPESRWKGVIEGNRLVFSAIQGIQTRSTVLNGVVNRLGIKLLSHEAKRIGGGRTAEFRIPESIRRAWRLPPYGSGPRALRVLRELGTAIEQSLGAERAASVVVDVAVLVAQADGEIDELESEALVEALQAVTNGDAEAARALVAKSLKTLRKQGADARVRDLGSVLPELRIVDDALSLAIAMAYANSGIAKEERTVIEGLAAAVGVSIEELGRRVSVTCGRIEAA